MRRSVLLLVTLTATSAFANQQATDAAMALAEANHPGQLEFHSSEQQGEVHTVILAVKGDPITRVRFDMDSNPADCKIGTACEQRFQKAYDEGIAAGIKLQAVNQAMQSCKVRPLAVESAGETTQFRLVVERDLHSDQAQQQLDELTACLSDFRDALPEDASTQQRSIALRILQPAKDTPEASGLLTFETRLPASRQQEVSYLIGAGPEDSTLTTAQLRLDPAFLTADEQRQRFSDAARSALGEQGHVPDNAIPWQTQLDAQQPQVLHTHILACSEVKQGAEPCQADMAVRLRYDLSTDTVSEPVILNDVVNERGQVKLPAF